MELPNPSLAYYPDQEKRYPHPDDILYERDLNEPNNGNDSNYRHGVDGNGNISGTYESIDNDDYVKSILEKTSLQSLNRGWNNRNEIFIISIMLSCKNYKLMHDMSSRNYNNIHKIMKIILVIFSSFLSVLTAYPGTCNSNELTIIQYSVTYIVTLFSILMNFFSYSQLSEKHKSAASEFLKIHHEIQQQMCLFKRDRLVAFRYISRIIKEYDRLIMTSPLIIPYILKKCKNDIEYSECNIRDIIREMTTIRTNDIHLQYNGNSSSHDSLGSANDSSGFSKRDGDMMTNSHFKERGLNGILMNNKSHLVIEGDIDDNEIEKCNSQQIKDLRLRFFKENSTYEYLRFLQNEIG